MCGAGLSSSTWCCVFKDNVKESSLTRLRAAAEPVSLWSGSLSHSSLPCTSLTWARSSVSSEESVPSSSLSSLVCLHPWPIYLCAHTFIGFVLSLTCESLWMRLTCVQGVRGFALLSVSKVNLVCLCIAGLCLVFTMETESVTPTVR